ncbi:Non-catalytic module family EXPN protein [Schizophyllum fasciatum]
MLQSLIPLLVFSLPFGASAHERGQNAKRHNGLAKRGPGDVERFAKRASNARMTYYEVGLGACGIVNVPSDFIVAVSADEWDAGLTHGYPSDVCFKSITIEYNGVTAQAQVTDRCESCPPFSGIDLSYDLFKVFAPNPEETGMIYANWWYNDGSGGGGGPTSTSTSETSTWTPPPETSTSETSTWSPPPPETTSSSTEWTESSTESATSSSSTKKHHSKTSSSEAERVAETSSASATSTSTAAAATSFQAGANNVVDSLRQAVIDMGGVIVAAAGAQA